MRSYWKDKYPCKKLLIKCFLTSLITTGIVAFFIYSHSERYQRQESPEEIELRKIESLNIHLENDVWIPDAGDNLTGWPMDIVPNIVHYVLFEEHKISYVHMLSMFSVLVIQKPETIYIHCDCDKIDDNDANWKRVLEFVNKTNDVTILIDEIEKPKEIYGIEVDESVRNFHGSDITRYRTLMKYGGIYLDNDVFVCQSLNQFRKFEFTLNWDEDQFLGSQVLMGNRNARFLKFTMETYRMYDTSKWYYNAGELPTRVILYKYPHLVHRIKVKFGVDAPAVCPYFYKEYHSEWETEYFTFHMVARGEEISWKDWCIGGGDHYMRNAKFNDELIRNLNNTFGEMARLVLFGTKHILEESTTAENTTPESTTLESTSTESTTTTTTESPTTSTSSSTTEQTTTQQTKNTKKSK